MERSAPENSLVPRPSETPLADEGVRIQISRMFGESLFGAWPDLNSHVPESRPHRRWRTFARRVAWLGVLGLVVVGGYALFRPGLTRQEAVETAHYATEVRTFLNDGALPQAAQFLPMVYEQGAAGETLEAHLDLTVFAEALLYRYYDAEAKRLEKIRPYLESTETLTPLRQLAKLTLLSRSERAQQEQVLERLERALPNHNQVLYLRATVLESQGKMDEASTVWSRAAKLGPAWLIQRFEQAKFEANRGNEVAAKKLATQIVRVDPASPWAALAMSAFALERPKDTTSVRLSDASVTVPSPVERYVEQLENSLALSRQGDSVRAKAMLFAALSEVHEASVFTLDAFDVCRQAKDRALMRELVGHPSWPRDSAVATMKAEQLKALGKSAP